jgi:hypothetical protein
MANWTSIHGTYHFDVLVIHEVFHPELKFTLAEQIWCPVNLGTGLALAG